MQLDWDVNVNSTRANDEIRIPLLDSFDNLIDKFAYPELPRAVALPFLYCRIFSIQSVVRDGSLALLTEALDAEANNVAST
jgi:hypothetical protein